MATPSSVVQQTKNIADAAVPGRSVLSALDGQDASHNAGVAQANATAQQALQNQYGQVGAGIFSGLQQQGQSQLNLYNANYGSLLNQYGALSGLGGNEINQRGSQPATPGAGNLAQQLNTSGSSGQDPSQNPYSLDANQQALLNQSNAQIAQSAKSAQAQFVQQMNNAGITDPRALQVGQEQLQEHFSALQQQTEAQFYQQVKTDKLAALQQIISQIGQAGQEGVSEEEAAGSGYLGLASGAQAAAQLQSQISAQQQQLSNQQLSGLFSLIGTAAGGINFGGGTTAGTGGAAGINVSGALTP